MNVTGNWTANPVALDLLKLETVPPTPDMDRPRAAAAEKAIQKVLADLPPFRLIGDITPMARGEQSPHVTGTCLVAPDVLAITIEAGKVTLGKVLDYVPQAGDDLSTKKDAQGIETVTLKRGGKEIGEIVGAGRQTPVHHPGFVQRRPVADGTGRPRRLLHHHQHGRSGLRRRSASHGGASQEQTDRLVRMGRQDTRAARGVPAPAQTAGRRQELPDRLRPTEYQDAGADVSQ